MLKNIYIYKNCYLKTRYIPISNVICYFDHHHIFPILARTFFCFKSFAAGCDSLYTRNDKFPYIQTAILHNPFTSTSSRELVSSHEPTPYLPRHSVLYYNPHFLFVFFGLKTACHTHTHDFHFMTELLLPFSFVCVCVHFCALWCGCHDGAWSREFLGGLLLRSHVLPFFFYKIYIYRTLLINLSKSFNKNLFCYCAAVAANFAS